MPKRIPVRVLWIVPVALFFATLACSADDVIGQRPQLPTPTVLAFSTATPGGRISVLIGSQPGNTVRSGPEQPQPIGQIVGPAATATAAYATRAAATATAAAGAIVPVFQPNECPSLGAPQLPLRPTSFGLFPQSAALFLSAGGATTTLESILRTWGAINDGRGVVQSDTDVTGDGVNEIVVTLSDPSTYRADTPSSGQLLVFGCDQKAYKLLYSTPYSAGTMTPELRRVGNMNGDGRAQIVYTQQLCAAAICTQAIQILNWNSLIGAFGTLNETPMDATNARVQVIDADEDGLLEVVITFNPSTDPAAGPYRRTVHIWDWNGANYVLGLIQQDAPIYRIHALYDADSLFRAGDFRGAIRAYDKLKDDPNLAAWLPSDPTILRALVNYRKLMAYAALRLPKSVEEMVNTINTENGPGSPTEVWGQLASGFYDSYKQNRSLKRVCAAVQNIFATRPDILGSINLYGANNHTYSAGELCPF